jgi:hypothetical protein
LLNAPALTTDSILLLNAPALTTDSILLLNAPALTTDSILLQESRICSARELRKNRQVQREILEPAEEFATGPTPAVGILHSAEFHFPTPGVGLCNGCPTPGVGFLVSVSLKPAGGAGFPRSWFPSTTWCRFVLRNRVFVFVTGWFSS